MVFRGNPNIVIVAKSFNPSIFSQIWLFKNKIFSEEELKADFVYTPMAVNAKTPEVDFIAVPDRIQLSFIDPTKKVDALVEKILGTIVRELPHTPFKAVGFNFSWLLHPQNQSDFVKINRKLFLAQTNPLTPISKEEDCRFGFYFSKKVEMGRLRLDIKPVTLSSTPDKGAIGEGLELIFNINCDLQESDKVEQILNFFGTWEPGFSLAENITQRVGEGWSSK